MGQSEQEVLLGRREPPRREIEITQPLMGFGRGFGPKELESCRLYTPYISGLNRLSDANDPQRE